MNLLSPLRSLITYLLVKSKTTGENIIVGDGFLPKINSRIKSWIGQGNINIGNNVSIGYNSELYVWNGDISIGHNTSLNDNCKIYENVKIGSNCLFASSIFISSGTHSIQLADAMPIKSQDKLNPVDKGIIIEDDCWLGFGVVIMPGIYIGKGAVIGANSVVTKNVFPYTINAGVPARKISKRLNFDETYSEIRSTEPSHWPFFYRGINYQQFDQLNCLQNGLEVIAECSVFFLKKIDFREIVITGICDNECVFNILINGSFALEKTMKKGEFILNHQFGETIAWTTQLGKGIPDDVSSIFNIITVSTKKDVSKSKRNESVWKVKSIKVS